MKEQTPSKKQLLNELDSLRGLLDSDTEDAPLPLLEAEDDGQLPLLMPEQKKPAEPASAAIKTADGGFDVKKALASRANPFLQKAHEMAQSKQSRDATASEASTTSKSGADKTAANKLTQSEINKLVDAVLDECLPHIEQTLRIHLTASLHRLNR